MTSRHLSLPVSKRNHSPAPLSEQSCLSSSSSSASCGAVKWIKWGIRISVFQKQELQLLSFISNCSKLHFHYHKIFAVHMNCTTHVISKSTCTLVALIAEPCPYEYLFWENNLPIGTKDILKVFNFDQTFFEIMIQSR